MVKREYLYNNVGLPTAVVTGSGLSDSLITAYTYTTRNAIATITDPNGAILSYDYDDYGRMSKAYHNGDLITENNYSHWENNTALSFEARGLENYVETKTYNNIAGTENIVVDEITYSYDDRDRLTEIDSRLFKWELFYDNNQTSGSSNYNGNINYSKATYKDWQNGTYTVTNGASVSNFSGTAYSRYAYTYDGLNRLVQANGDITGTLSSTLLGDATYSYDLIGNLTQLNRHQIHANGSVLQDMEFDYLYTNSNNQLTRIQVGNIGSTNKTTFYDYTYDDVGNLKTDTKRNITNTQYGRANLPQSVSVNGTVAKYLYNTEDLRMYKTQIQSETVTQSEYYLMAGGKTIAIYDMINNEINWYIHGAERLAKVEHGIEESWLGTTFGEAQENQPIEEALEEILVTSSSGQTTISLPDVLYKIDWHGGGMTYVVASQFNSDTTVPYTIIQTIPLYSTAQQFEMSDKNNESILISIAELLGLTEPQAPSATISNYDPYDVVMTLPSNPPVPQATYYVYDHLGNTRLTYTTTLSIYTLDVESYTLMGVFDYFPYGKILRQYVNSTQEKYLTTQHERDVETGLDYRGARFYDGDVARFLSLDPLAAEFPAWSDYSYVLGNPVMLVDPTGLAPESNGWSDDNIDLANRFGAFGNGHERIELWFKVGVDSWDDSQLNITWNKSNTEVTLSGILTIHVKVINLTKIPLKSSSMAFHQRKASKTFDLSTGSFPIQKLINEKGLPDAKRVRARANNLDINFTLTETTIDKVSKGDYILLVKDYSTRDIKGHAHGGIFAVSDLEAFNNNTKVPTHEFGHWFGFEDMPDGNPAFLMSYVPKGGPYNYGLTNGDRASLLENIIYHSYSRNHKNYKPHDAKQLVLDSIDN